MVINRTLIVLALLGIAASAHAQSSESKPAAGIQLGGSASAEASATAAPAAAAEGDASASAPPAAAAPKPKPEPRAKPKPKVEATATSAALSAPAAEGPAAPAPVAVVAAPAPPVPTPAPAADAADAADESAEAEPADAPGPLELHLYGDVNLSFTDQDADDPTFSLGDLQLDAGGRIADNVELITSTLLQFQGNDADVELDIAFMQWEVDPGFGLRIGRNRSMTGRYYRAAPSRLGELATTSPLLASDEDDGGPLLAHQLGVEIFGETSSEGGMGVRYGIGIGNGRGVSSRVPSGNVDANGFKAISVHLSLLPAGAEGLDFGVSGYTDRIPSGLRDTAGVELISEEIEEFVGAAHLAYITEGIDLQAELFYLYHEGRDSKADAQLVGGFLQVGVPVHDFTPYTRLEVMDRDVNDIYFNASGVPFQVTDLRLGVGYRIAQGAVLKFEYGGDLERDVHGGTLQAAFGI